MKTKLKPCPFCGGIFIRTTRVGHNGEYACWCEFCAAEGPWKLRRRDAIEAWNDRVEDNNASKN